MKWDKEGLVTMASKPVISFTTEVPFSRRLCQISWVSRTVRCREFISAFILVWRGFSGKYEISVSGICKWSKFICKHDWRFYGDICVLTGFEGNVIWTLCWDIFAAGI